MQNLKKLLVNFIIEEGIMRYLLVVLTIFLLVGCNGTIESEVNVSDLLAGENKIIKSDLYVEIPSCTSYEDSRKPSKSLLEAQSNVPRVFEGAEFVESFSKEFKSYAHFSIPTYLSDGEKMSSTQLNFIFTKDVYLAVSVPKQIMINLQKLKEESFGLNDLNMKFKIILKNNTKSDFNFNLFSTFYDDKPIQFSSCKLSAGNTCVIRLSDVSTEVATNSQIAYVMYKPGE